MEASQTPNLVDNNFIWNIDGNGIYGNDTDELMIFHNLVANTTGALVNAVVATQRKLNGRWLTANRNRILNNVFINGGQPVTLSGEDNLVDFNLYVSTGEPIKIDLKSIQANGQDKNSSFIRAFAEFRSESLNFSWITNDEVPQVPVLEEIKFDINSKLRQKSTTSPGPFESLPKELKFLKL